MSEKSLDKHNRWRSRTVSFRMSPEEDEHLDTLVRLSGLTKQDYIIQRLLEGSVVVQGNIRVFKALKDQLAQVLTQLVQILVHCTAGLDPLQLRKHLGQLILQSLEHPDVSLDHNAAFQQPPDDVVLFGKA